MKASDVIEMAYKSPIYCAYLGGPVDGKEGRLCFVIRHLVVGGAITQEAESAAKFAINHALTGYTFLSDFLDVMYGGCETVYYNKCPRRRKQALAFWRNLVAELRAKGE